MSDPDDPPPQHVEQQASISAHGDVSGDVTVTPFRVQLFEACKAALSRLEMKSGPGALPISKMMLPRRHG